MKYIAEINIQYNTGEKFFEYGEKFFVNSCYEQAEPHLHAHDFIEISYVASGNGVHTVGDTQFNVSRGDLFLLNYDIPHEFRSVSNRKDKKMLVYNCVFKPEFIDKSLIDSRCFSDIFHVFLFRSIFNEGTAESDMFVLKEVSHEIEDIFIKMLQEFAVKNLGHVEILRAHLIELLVKIFRLYRQNKYVRNSDKQKKYFDNAIEFMKIHYKEDIKVEELAAMSFLSRNYFCACFKECTGVTVLEYIQKLRIEESCKLLEDTNLKITEIAETVGYSDIKFFNRLFKKYIEKSPGVYRKDIKS